MIFDGMNLTTLYFFVFLLLALLLYYALGRMQKYVLVLASIAFYFFISRSDAMFRVKLFVLMLFVAGVSYVGGLLIDRSQDTLKSVVTALCVLALVSILFYTKYAYNLFHLISALLGRSDDLSFWKVAAVIGISYFNLSAIGYLIGVSWGLYPAERDPFILTLFVFYFPQLISGPVTRYPEMKAQFSERHSFDGNNIYLGIRRMLWGYFKKLVISERFALIVAAVYGDYENYSGMAVLGATLCYAVQLYTDFSGCMDIIMGTSQLFAIKLPENFNAPFMSESVQEFWQRWHITLGTWFKDYVMYPMQKTALMVKLGKYSRQKLGKRLGKKLPFYLSMTVLWVLIGIWHGGTAYYFIASAVIPFCLLLFSDLLQPVYPKLVSVLHVNTECESWHWFRRGRTALLICICWVFVCASGTLRAVGIMKHIFTRFVICAPSTVSFESFGLNTKDAVIMISGLMILFLADQVQYRGTSITEVMNRQNLLIRYGMICFEALCILAYGMVGSSSFIYFQF